MINIISGSAASFTLSLQRDGKPVPIESSSSVTVRLFDASGATPLGDAVTLTADAAWSNGELPVVMLPASTTGPSGSAMLVLTSTEPAMIKWFEVNIQTAAIEKSVLFVKDIAVARMRQDRLMMAAQGFMPDVAVTDDYLWDKLRAAESETAHELRVPLVPTAFFPSQPTDEEIAALGGKPWGIDPGYDYSPTQFGYNDSWGLLRTRQKPIQSVSRVRFAYPGGDLSHYDLPLDWLRIEQKSGTIQFVPSSSAFIAPLNAFVMQAIGNGRTIPLAIQLTYVAGLVDVPRNYPELLDVIYKKAALKVVEDLFIPQSGSISADGLSQSVSVDMEKYHDTIDRILNGGLMTAIHGIRVANLGA